MATPSKSPRDLATPEMVVKHESFCCKTNCATSVEKDQKGCWHFFLLFTRKHFFCTNSAELKTSWDLVGRSVNVLLRWTSETHSSIVVKTSHVFADACTKPTRILGALRRNLLQLNAILCLHVHKDWESTLCFPDLIFGSFVVFLSSNKRDGRYSSFLSSSSRFLFNWERQLNHTFFATTAQTGKSCICSAKTCQFQKSTRKHTWRLVSLACKLADCFSTLECCCCSVSSCKWENTFCDGKLHQIYKIFSAYSDVCGCRAVGTSHSSKTAKQSIPNPFLFLFLLYSNIRKFAEMVSCCIVTGCKMKWESTTDTTTPVLLFRFPMKKDKRLQQWKLALNKGDSWEPQPYNRICSRHFVHGKSIKKTLRKKV